MTEDAQINSMLNATPPAISSPSARCTVKKYISAPSMKRINRMEQYFIVRKAFIAFNDCMLLSAQYCKRLYS